jgi:ribonuclease PH
MRSLDDVKVLAKRMAKFKTGFTTDREANEMRHIEVEIDFTPNALASILYRQGDTVHPCLLHKGSSIARLVPSRFH